MNTVIRNGRLLDADTQLDQVQDLFISDDKIVGLGQAPEAFSVDQEIDAQHQWVFPGIIDLSARLREPGLEHKATIASETFAAASAGITTLCCMPDTNPIIDTPAVAELIRQRAEKAGFARVLCIGALTQNLAGTQLSEMGALREAGCVGVANVEPLQDTQMQRRAMEYAATHGLIVFLTPEDRWLRGDGCVHEGAMSTRLGLPGIPEAAETTAVARDLALVEQIGVRAHFCRLSTARAVRMIARAQFDGLPVSADVCAHQLFLTEMDIGNFNSHCHVLPPLRTQRDRDGLIRGVQEGVVGAVCSDHQPHEADAKLDSFGDTKPGISALETLLPLSMRLLEAKHLDLLSAIGRLTSGPAKILGHNDVGSLAVGKRADICIYNPNRIWQLEAQQMTSHGHNSPFLHWEFTGQVTHTLLAGKLVFSRTQLNHKVEAL